ncbi:hypothetical protein SO802_031111 [Lithocarpus litseifolius]|uniref:Non-specific serine/threonine protein kinase n=1 Tax=Lithocarpus litseifolius TaxID=425828 RepID=A0AAW2BQ40_9ROSI
MFSTYSIVLSQAISHHLWEICLSWNHYLSSNNLTAEIPVQLVDSLTFLSFFNLSFNQLVGKIPQGKQFSTFSNDSYKGNKGLCGYPLQTECTSDKASPPSATQKARRKISTTLIGFDWQFIL